MLLLAFISVLLIPGCQKDNDTRPTPGEPEEFTPPIETIELYGVRLIIDSLVCDAQYDNGSDEEFYGYLEAWTTYENGYLNTKEKYETKTTNRALMWFAEGNALNYKQLKVGESVDINEVIDFIFNPSTLGLATIHLKGRLKEWDGNGYDSHDLIGTTGIDIKADQIVINQQSELKFDKHHGTGTNDWTRASFYYHFELFNPRSSGILPSGKLPSDIFTDLSIYPELPTPTRYEDMPPSISEKLVVGQMIRNNFHPSPIQVNTQLPVSGLGNGPFYAYKLQDLSSPPIFVSNNAPFNSPEVEPEQNYNEGERYGLVYIDNEDKEAKIIENKTRLLALENTPRLQLMRYYKPIRCWRLPAGAYWSKEISYTNSWTEEMHVEFSLTMGYGGELFSSEIKSIFGSSWEYNWSETESETLSYTAPNDKNVMYIVWQLFEEYRLINAEGNIFSDPNYQFKSMEVVSIPTNHIVPRAYLFNAQ